jgi:hypothetical protein
LIKELLVILGILLLLFEVNCFFEDTGCAGSWKRGKEKSGPINQPYFDRRPKRIVVFVERTRARGQKSGVKCWSLGRCERGGPKKKIQTEGYFCPSKSCEYYRITDEKIHALVANGKHGRQEIIQDLKCQA